MRNESSFFFKRESFFLDFPFLSSTVTKEVIINTGEYIIAIYNRTMGRSWIRRKNT